MTYLLKCWDPSISRERLKLETSNLAHRLATGCPNEKMQNCVKKGLKGSRDLLLEFCVEARNFKFSTQIGHYRSKQKNAKLGQNWSIRGYVTYFF